MSKYTFRVVDNVQSTEKVLFLEFGYMSVRTVHRDEKQRAQEYRVVRKMRHGLDGSMEGPNIYRIFCIAWDVLKCILGDNIKIDIQGGRSYMKFNGLTRSSAIGYFPTFHRSWSIGFSKCSGVSCTDESQNSAARIYRPTHGRWVLHYTNFKIPFQTTIIGCSYWHNVASVNTGLRAGRPENCGTNLSRCKRFLCKASRPIVGPSQLPIQGYRGCF